MSGQKLVKTFENCFSFLLKHKRIVLVWLSLFAAFISAWIVCLCLPYNVDSDMSGELILGKLLAQQGRIITPDWYYGMELRIFDHHLIFALLFNFFSNWRVVRLGAIAIWLAILAVVAIWCGRQLGLGQYSILLATSLLLPASSAWFRLFIIGGDYTASLFFGLLCVGLAAKYARKNGKSGQCYLFLAALASFGASLSGLRFVVCLVVPLALSGLSLWFGEVIANRGRPNWQGTSFRLAVVGLVMLLVSSVGYLINSLVLPYFYTFRVYSVEILPSFLSFLGDYQVANRTPAWSMLGKVATGMSNILGWHTGTDMLAHTGQFGVVILVIILIISCVYGLLNKKNLLYRWLSVFIIFNLLIHNCIYVFTNMDYVERYHLPVIFWIWVLVWFLWQAWQCKKAYKYTLLSLFVIFLFIRTFLFYGNCLSAPPSDLAKVAQFLKSTDYKRGMASFWNANALWELTGGQVEMWAWAPELESVSAPYAIFRWWQSNDHVLYPPQGKMIVVYRDDELKRCQWRDKLKAADIIYQDNGYTIYAYDNYEIFENSVLSLE